MTQRQFTVIFIDRQDNYFDFFTNFSEFTWVVETFSPAQITDVDHTANTCFQFYEYTVRSNVFNDTFMSAFNRETIIDVFPRIFSQLFDR
ncbi:hypothetical protein D9M69_546170 [compost metagenome]